MPARLKRGHPWVIRAIHASHSSAHAERPESSLPTGMLSGLSVFTFQCNIDHLASTIAAVVDHSQEQRMPVQCPIALCGSSWTNDSDRALTRARRARQEPSVSLGTPRMFHAASGPAEARSCRLGAAWRLGVEIRLDLVARGRIELPAVPRDVVHPWKQNLTWANTCTARLFPASGVPRESADVVRHFAWSIGFSR